MTKSRVMGGILLMVLTGCHAGSSPSPEQQSPRAERLKDVLVFLKPAWYRHASLDSLAHWFQHFGWDNGINVDTTDHPEIFNLDDLERYDVVVFISTTDLGNALNDAQKSALIDWHTK